MNSKQERLPRRDFVLIPMLCGLSVLLTLAVAEMSARVIFPEHQQDSCAIASADHQVAYRPNCRSTVKSVESPWLENVYNACGYRTADPCDPKPAGGYRVAVLGSSISSGYLVPYNETAAARLVADLKERCRIPVDVQNLAAPGAGIGEALDHLDAALALKPDVIVMAISGHDLEVLPAEQPVAKIETDAAAAPAQHGLLAGMRDLTVWLRVSRAVQVAQHFIYENIDTYLPLYLKHGDEADFLRPPLSRAWQNRLAIFGREIKDIQAQAHQSGVPFLLVFVPPRADALLLHWKHRPPEIDPQMLGRLLASIAERKHAGYIDLTETFGNRSDVDKLYYPLDSHPDSAANELMAQAIERTLFDHRDLPRACSELVEAAQ